MSAIASIDLYRCRHNDLAVLDARTSDDAWFKSNVVLTSSASSSPETVGSFVKSALEESRVLRLDDDSETLRSRPMNVEEAALLKASGVASYGEFVREAALVQVFAYPDGLIVVAHTEGHGGEMPGYRRLADYDKLNSPSDAGLGASVLESLSKYVWVESL